MKYLIYAVAALLAVAAAVKIASAVILVQANKAYAQKEYKKALRLFAASAKMPLSTVSDKTMYAVMLMRAGEFAEAERGFTEIIMSDKTKPRDKFSAKAYRCMAQQKRGDLDGALENAEGLFEICKNTLTYGVLGYLRQLKGGAELEFCKEAYEYNSDERDICDNLAVAYLRSGDLENAEKLTAELREKHPDFAEAFYHSALVAVKKGDFSAAREFAGHLAECRFNALTTVSQKEIDDLKEVIKNAGI